MTNSTASIARVRAYFDTNTSAFIRFGQGREIRRAVWAPEVSARSEAFRYVDRLVLKELAAYPERDVRILDLGCGVGASLSWLLERTSASGVGVTISSTQAGLARRQLEQRGLGERARIFEASFTELPRGIGSFQVAFAIEAFVLSPDPRSFLQQAASCLVPGGRLVIVDDVLTVKGSTAQGRVERGYLADFKAGWRVSSLETVEHIANEARTCGLTLRQSIDLTPYLELRRPRDLVITAMVAVGRHLPLRTHPRFGNLLGGNGLQLALVTGLLEYRAMVFERSH